MKYVGIVIALLSMLFVALPVQADLIIGANEEMIANGGMELPGTAGALPTGWTKMGGAFETYGSSAHSGSMGVSAYSGGAAYQMQLCDGFAANVNSFDFSAWMKSEEASPAGAAKISIEAGHWDGSTFTGGYESRELLNDGTTTWKEYSVSIPVYHGAVETNCISVSLRDQNSSYAVYFDDVSMKTTPEPGTLSLIGTGLIALVCYAWRKRK